MQPETMIILSKEVWVALITFVAAPLVASVAANLSLRGAVTALTEKMKEFDTRLLRLERGRRRRKAKK